MFNEDTRVKIPSILHLTRLGYEYISLKDREWNKDNNIFTDIFLKSVAKINPDVDSGEIKRLYKDIDDMLGNTDLGKAFYERLVEKSGIKLIDFDDFENNEFNVVTELPCKNGDESFRPDITLLINGMPLVFLEVKKPNNKDGILAERERMYTRFANNKFRKFMNITQVMMFSNNMEYDDGSPEPLEGAFYSTPGKRPQMNYFREEENLNIAELLADEGENIENFVLKDNNMLVIKGNQEFKTNKKPDTPTNRLSTSLFSKDRLAFLLQYAIAYVGRGSKIQKHIMRYPQIFATKAIEQGLKDGVRKGIIWHTQGSGKTALAYYNVKYLKNYYSKRGVIPKFYFIVDRLDLYEQSAREFASRGLKVNKIQSREEFSKSIKETTAIHNDTGENEITVVNIQKFEDDPNVIETVDYNVDIQRVYFLDEVHRSYNPKGSFLANLERSDSNAIKIGLTGTPLLGKLASTNIFGNYLHKYYYNSSIADGYTLRLIREEIETSYKVKLQGILKELEKRQVLKGSLLKEKLFSHSQFVNPMLDYILNDFRGSKIRFDDDSIGAMVVCDSSKQARKMFELFQEKKQGSETAALILHDEGTKEERKAKADEFKEGKIDYLFVYNMLLTGFDAPRLKKLYLGRVIRKHSLLQALTRVNRTYKNFRYGFVVDFADISKEFDKTNKEYFDELQAELGDEMESYSSIFKSSDEIEEEIEEIKERLFEYNTENAEEFSSQVSKISDISTMQGIKKALENAKEIYNLIRLLGHHDILDRLDFNKFKILYREASNHLMLLNQKAKLEAGDSSGNILDYNIEDIVFLFKKVDSKELKMSDELKVNLSRTREAFTSNFDKKDPEFISLKEELERLFTSKNINETTGEAMDENLKQIKSIYGRINELNRRNDLLKDKYKGDTKYARFHKRVVARKDINANLSKVKLALMGIKTEVDNSLIKNSRLIKSASFVNLIDDCVLTEFEDNNGIDLEIKAMDYLQNLIIKEYRDEDKLYNGG